MIEAKLYKGPHHNKRIHVDESAYAVIVDRLQDSQVSMTDMDSTAPVSIQRGRYVKTRHTHPDGSVFFVWEGWLDSGPPPL